MMNFIKLSILIMKLECFSCLYFCIQKRDSIQNESSLSESSVPPISPPESFKNPKQENKITPAMPAKYHETMKFISPINAGFVIKVINGNSITIASQLLNSHLSLYRFQIQLAGINCPDLQGRTVQERTLAIEARKKLNELIFGHWIQLQNAKHEKYGRILADVFLGNLHVNNWMLENGLAVLSK